MFSTTLRPSWEFRRTAFNSPTSGGLIPWVPAAANSNGNTCLLLRLVPDMLVACDTLHCKVHIDLACRNLAGTTHDVVAF